ncbi:MAG: ribosome silencing factor [Frankiaceae bacterium]
MSATPQAIERARAAAVAAADKKAQDILILDVSDQLVITDCFVLASAVGERQVQAVVDEIELRLRHLGARPARREGERDNRWVLLDYLDVVVHVQHVEERVYYVLERLWKDCPRVPFEEASVGAAATA